jgi:hypothetical protein
VVDSLCRRFIINLPAEELNDPVRVMYHTEAAHWFFVDEYCDSGNYPQCSALGKMGFQHFALEIFQV